MIAIHYICITILLIIYIFTKITKEGLSYEDKRQYFFCKYSPFLDKNSAKCRHFFNSLSKKNEPLLIGTVYTKREDNDKIYSLYKTADVDDANGYSRYYIKLYKHGDYVYQEIPTQYDLYDGQEVCIPHHDTLNPFIVQMYENDQQNCRACHSHQVGRHHLCNNCWRSYGTRYNERDVPWRNVGYVYKKNGKRNKFYKLYEKEYDTARNKYKYYIHDVRNDLKIPLEDEKQLYTDDKINVNGISKDYFVHKYKLCDPGFDFD